MRLASVINDEPARNDASIGSQPDGFNQFDAVLRQSWADIGDVAHLKAPWWFGHGVGWGCVGTPKS